MNEYHPWSKEDDDLLKKYAAEFHSSSRIAKLISADTGIERTKNSVVGRCYRQGVKLHRTREDAGNATKARRTYARIATAVKKIEVSKKKVTVKRVPVPKPSAPVIKKDTTPKEQITVELDEAKFVGIHQLTLRTCRFPVKELSRSSFLYCGQVPHGSSVYCKGHARVCFQPPKSKK